MEFDHLFICVDDAAEGAAALKDFGLTEGSANQHPGQGTANRRFFFNNSFIELLFVSDRTELKSEWVMPTGLHQRLSTESVACPYGVCFRSNGNAEAAFPSFAYKPKYLPPDLQVDVGIAPVAEPMWFYLSFASRPDQAPADRVQPLKHAIGFQEITSVEITMPRQIKLSESAQCVDGVSGVELVGGDDYMLKLGFDGECSGQVVDFRPVLPVLISW